VDPVNSTPQAQETTARMSTVAPLAATPWATPVCPPFGTGLRNRSAVTSMHTQRQGYGATAVSMVAVSTVGTSANGLAAAGIAAKQDRPPRGVPR
jgi:hypothetical protein